MRILLLLSLFLSLNTYAQVNEDSLKQIWNNKALEDTTRLNANILLANYYLESNQDSSIKYIQLAYDLSKENEHLHYQARSHKQYGIFYQIVGKPDSSIKNYTKAIDLFEKVNDQRAKAGCLINMGMTMVRSSQKEEGIATVKEGIKVCDEIGETTFKMNALVNLAVIYLNEGNVDQAILGFKEVLAAVGKKEYGTPAHLGALVNLGYCLAKKGDHAQAIDYLNQCIHLAEEKQNNNVLLYAYNFLGNSYKALGETKNAEKAFLNSYHLADSIGDTYSATPAMINLAELALENGQNEKARELFTKAYEIRMEQNALAPAIKALSELANMDLREGKIDSAQNKYTRGLKIAIELKHIDQEGGQNLGLGEVAFELGNYPLSIRHFDRARAIGFEIGSIEIIRDASHGLMNTYEQMGKPQKALFFYKEHIKYKDSIQRDENKTAALKQEFRYQYEKKASADSVRTAKEKEITDVQLAAQDAQLKQEQTQRYALIGGLGLLGLFGGVMYNRFQLTKKQNKIIEQQKLEVEDSHERLSEKNREILDSIEYAKRIQSAILPPNKLVKEYLHESFILYLPKDVVAGDFYWMESHADLVMFAAADCTGHGVPGAMVSVVCVNGLNRSVREFGLRKANHILDKTRELVIKEFEKSEEEVKDGMDISLCVLNTKTNELNWAGAHNPLWVVKAGKEEIFEIKADKQPIGKFELSKPFQDHHIQLEKGDTVYLFTDGFPDQFGGEKGKKYKSLQFKKTLVELSKQDIQDQKEKLETEFTEWQGDHEQLDDVCVIGVRV